jgi:hypothetical protein
MQPEIRSHIALRDLAPMAARGSLGSSQQSVTRTVEKIVLKVLMITEPEVNFRNGDSERALMSSVETVGEPVQ